MNARHSLRLLSILVTAALLGCGGGGSAPADSGVCVKETDQAYCQRLGKNCEVLTGFDNCGAGRSVNCGMCTFPATCGGDTQNVCTATVDAGPGDSGVPDSGVPDSGVPDSGVPDSGVPDSGVPDSGVPDAGPGDAGCPIACPTAPHYLKGTFTITTNLPVVNGTPYTHAFDAVVGESISFVASFDITAQTRQPGSGLSNDKLLLACTGPDFFFSGDTSAVMAGVKANIQSRVPISCSLESKNQMPQGTFFSFGGASGQPMFTFELSLTPSTLTYGADNVPNLAPFTASTATASLRRFAANGTFTDYASGSASIRFDLP